MYELAKLSKEAMEIRRVYWFQAMYVSLQKHECALAY